MSEIPVDDETRAALLLFNQRLEESAAEARAAKRIAKAERAKDEAASRVRNVGNDSNATAEQKAEAETAYKAAVDEFQRIKENPEPAESSLAEVSADEEAPTPTAAAQEEGDAEEGDAGEDDSGESDTDEAAPAAESE
ncbi:MAG: hypothetical protein HKN94_06480 [Acidimicrobiales bacterium]|nr:hypothetical protein [Acidimicrobiales bacterium]RZV47480.1 MAG: hypothetical protein EX269_04760 [Acidimicrobiales bacterium]